MKVVISAGGTGGHIYPALAIVNKIKQREPNSEILYIGTHNRMEKAIVPKYGINYKPIEVYGFNRKNLFSNFKTLKFLIKSFIKCKKIIKEFKPDIVIGVGGYVTVPVIYAAYKLDIKTFIHEQNSVSGSANTFLSRFASAIGVSFKSSIKFFPEYKTTFTGNPCSEQALKVLPISKTSLGLREHKKFVLIVMGSLGSNKINEYFIRNMKKFGQADYDVLFISGEQNYLMFKDTKLPSNVHIVPYIEQLTRVMKLADLVVSRAGASMLSELIVLEIPAILIPSPYVVNNHQYKNTIDLTTNEAAILIEEKDMDDNILVATINKVINNKQLLDSIKKNIRPFKVIDSSSRIYKILKELVDRK
ncbi:MAG: undecaprenyldiphospho-muramoylpentapeptide beta-N-acetylglucosaminyltransferase [Bacilli bacterium]